ncbi:MAG: hypothetical protein IKR19_08040 [Acholeplasmatales bacterium]|nr:hypothetical protein [Acholeplasmatales bacterium]
MQESTKNIIYRSGIDMDNPEIEVFEVEKMTKDMKKIILNVPNVSKDEVRTLVTLFYQIQDIRIHISEQIRSIERQVSATGKNSEGNLLILNWVLQSMAATEKGIKDSLELICKSDEVGRWLLSINGIGPALGAGCLAYFDVEGKQYASSFISYAGLNDNNRPWLGKEKSKKIIDSVIAKYAADQKKPKITDEMVEEISALTQWKFGYLREQACNDKGTWNKEKLCAACAKIPYNADLKTHMWKVGKSFEYLKSNKKSLYGKLLAERIALEIKRNEEGYYKPLIEQHMAEKNYSKGTETYKAYMEGKLPMSEINARCRRWTEKIFISHLFEEMYRVSNDKIPPRYYSLEHCDGHHDEIGPEVEYTKVTEEK